MTLCTKHKIQLASFAFKLVRMGRRVRGQPMEGQFQRKTFLWELDLREVVDFMIYLSGAFEGYLDNFIRNNTEEGDVTLDIGANIGAHTLTMGKAVGTEGKTYAIEATEYAFSKLVRNIALNPEISQRIQPIHCVLRAEEDGAPLTLYSSWPFESPEARHPSHQGVQKTPGEAREATLDTIAQEINLSRLNLIKLDVDGHEWDVISGGQDTLRAFQPLILMELAPDYNEAEGKRGFQNIHRLLRELGYRFFDFRGRRLPDEADLLSASIPPGASRNVVAKPVGYARELNF